MYKDIRQSRLCSEGQGHEANTCTQNNLHVPSLSFLGWSVYKYGTINMADLTYIHLWSAHTFLTFSLYLMLGFQQKHCRKQVFLLGSIAAHRDHFSGVFMSVCVRLSGSRTFLEVIHRYISQATYAFRLLLLSLLSAETKLNHFLCIGCLCHKGHGFSSFLLYYTTQTEMFTRKLCDFIIRNYIQLSPLIRSIVLSLHTWKNPDIFTPFITWGKRSGNI